MQRGALIAIEGIDGAGKTTQVELLAKRLREMGKDVVTSKEPTNGPWGRKIRESAVHGRMGLEDELRAFVEDRKEHVRDLIEPALSAGRTVILDRYYFSTIAYQGSRGGNSAEIERMMRSAAPEPDTVIILDVPAETGVMRVQARDSKANQFEDIDNLRAVRSAFQALAKDAPSNIVLVDGSADKLKVHNAILDKVLNGVLNKQRC